MSQDFVGYRLHVPKDVVHGDSLELMSEIPIPFYCTPYQCPKISSTMRALILTRVLITANEKSNRII